MLLLAIGAGLFLLNRGEQQATPAPANASAVAVPAGRAADPAAPAPAATVGNAVKPDHAANFAEAVAAAERSGAANGQGANALSPPQGLDLLQKLDEQARKETLPLTSPFGPAPPAK